MNGNMEELRKELKVYLARTGRSQTEVAKAIGQSPAALSQWMRGSYKGDAEALTEKVSGYLGIEAKRAEAAEKPEFVRTAIAEDVWEVCEYAHVYCDIGVVYGEAGMGKTWALREYCRTHRDAIYLQCDPSCTTPQAILEMTLEKLARRVQGLNALRRMIRDLVEAVQGSGRLLVLDDAQFMNIRTLEVIRVIHDQAEIGVVLSGNYDVYTRMHGGGTAAFAQLFSRVGIRRKITLGVRKQDVSAIAGDAGADCVKYLHRRAREQGGLRRMVKILMMGRKLAKSEGEPLNIRHLETAAATLIGGQAAA